MKNFTTTWLSLALLIVFGAAGCEPAQESDGSSDPISDLPPGTMDDHSDHSEDAHNHPVEGPHHGDLVELGNEEFHAEVVHDHESGSLSVYILDGSATKEVAIDAKELTINVTDDGTPKQFTLTAQPAAGDEDGLASHFVSDSSELAAHLDEEGNRPRLVVTINGKSYRGSIEHAHDHEGHDHDHAKPAP